MSQFHLSVKTIRRSKGQSAVCSSAYRTASRLWDRRRGKYANYLKKRAEVVATFIAFPPDAPSWGREELWNQAELAEKRKNSCVGREIVVALPVELPASDHVSLLKEFVNLIATTHLVPIEVSIHVPRKNRRRRWSSRDVPINIHAHLQMAARKLMATGFGEKTRKLDQHHTGRVEIKKWRLLWAELVNARLAARGSDARIDARSHRDRGMMELPTIKEGVGPGADERRQYNVRVQEFNHQWNELERDMAEANAQEHGIDQLEPNQSTESNRATEDEGNAFNAPDESEAGPFVDDADCDNSGDDESEDRQEEDFVEYEESDSDGDFDDEVHDFDEDSEYGAEGGPESEGGY